MLYAQKFTFFACCHADRDRVLESSRGVSTKVRSQRKPAHALLGDHHESNALTFSAVTPAAPCPADEVASYVRHGL